MRIPLLICLFILSCQEPKSNISSSSPSPTISPKYSLAQWSYHKELFAGDMSNTDFIREASEMGFDGVEFVSQFFQDKVEDFDFLDTLKSHLHKHNIAPIMIMVDLAGDLGDSDLEARAHALEAHKKWVDASNYIGCKYTRVNAHGNGSPDEALTNCKSALTELATYAEENGITILVENHGGHSSDADWLIELIESTYTTNVKALADFDNWCLARENGELWGAPCIKWYDRYEGMDKLLPYAAGLSLKTFEFDTEGYAVRTDFKKMFALIKKHDYQGYLGVEYEGDLLPAKQGILKTLALARRLDGSAAKN